MTNLYICYTRYQFLITLLKVNENEDNTLVTLFKLSEIEENKLKEFKFFSKVFYCDEYDFLFFKPKKFIKCIKYYQFLKSFSNIYLFLDHRIIGHFFNRFNIKYHLLEDGYDFFRFKKKKEIIFDNKFKNKIYNFFFKPKDRGYGKSVIDIEVNNKKELEEDIRYKKMIEVPRKELFMNISKERKEKILSMFEVSEFEYSKDKGSVLILTQPLWQDKFDLEVVITEDEQIEYYGNIIDKYKNEYDIYFKVHPRDNTDYSTFKDAIFLDKNIPMELYEFIGNYTFDIGITHSSTVLYYLNNVKEKIVLKNLEKNYE